MKKIKFTLFLTLLLCLAHIDAFAHDFEVDGIYFSYLSETNKTVAVTFKGYKYNTYSDEYSGNVVIPASVTYQETTYSVTSIGSRAFWDCPGLTSIEIPNSVTSIGTDAFYDCTGLKKVFNNSSLSITKGSSGNGYVGFYANAVFNNCTQEGDFVFSNVNGTKYVCDYTGTATSISLPDVFGVAEYTFSGRTDLKSIEIPNSVTSIGSRAFYGCTGLTSVVIPNSVTSISGSVFRGCTGLTSIEIPNSVTSIGSYAFYGCPGLTSIEIPNSVTSIGESAFSGCSSLESITLPFVGDKTHLPSDNYQYPFGYIFGTNSYTGGTSTKQSYYGNSTSSATTSTYYVPSSLKAVKITGSSYIPFGAFYGCTGLTSIEIPNSVTSIGNSAFYGCTGLTSVEIPNSVTSIGGDAFRGCTGLTSIVIPNSVTSIGDYAFSGCTGLTSVVIPNSVTSIGDYAFAYCTGLTSIEIPNSVTSIGGSAFSGCKGLTSIEIPSSVTSIGEYAFRGCTGIQSLTIGSGVTSIGENAFSYYSNGKYYSLNPAKTIWLCNTAPEGYSQAKGKVNYVANNNYSNLANVTVYPYLSSMFEVDGVKYVPVNPSERTCDAIDCTYAVADSIIQIKETVSYKGIAMNVQKIQPYCCIGNNNIKKATIHPIKADVSDYAFQNCTGLDSVQVSNDGNIGTSAFAGCTSLKVAVVSNNGNIGNYAFQNNTSLQSVQISQANNLGGLAFDGCSELKTAVLDIQGNIGQKAFQNCAKMQSVQLGDNVNGIGNYAFSGCKALTEIVIPNATKSIGTYCFQNCSAMQKVVMGDSLKTVPEYAFAGCASLQDVTIGSHVSTIGQYAFSGCSTLPRLIIPSAVTSIGNYAFSGCTKLGTLAIDDRKTTLTLGSNGNSPLFADCPLDSVYIGGKISYNTGSSYGYSPFYRNTSLRTIVITDEETEIYQNEFYGCTGLKNVKIGDGVSKIGDYAFSGCSSLEGFAFGDGMTSIGKEAFSDCNALTEIYSTAEVPPTCGSQALEDINKWTCTLYVPKENIAAYQNADQWKDFFFINENAFAPANYTLTYVVDGEVYQTVSIKEGKEITAIDAPAKEGYTFSGWSEIPETMPANDVIITGTFTEINGLAGVSVEDDASAKTYYNLQGQKVAAPQRGHLYLRKGKKTLIR